MDDSKIDDDGAAAACLIAIFFTKQCKQNKNNGIDQSPVAVAAVVITRIVHTRNWHEIEHATDRPAPETGIRKIW